MLVCLHSASLLDDACKSPNDPKLSDGGGWRGPCMVGGKAAAEARAVTAVAVRCSAWLGVAGLELSCLNMIEWNAIMLMCDGRLDDGAGSELSAINPHRSDAWRLVRLAWIRVKARATGNGSQKWLGWQYTLGWKSGRSYRAGELGKKENERAESIDGKRAKTKTFVVRSVFHGFVDNVCVATPNDPKLSDSGGLA